MTALLGADPLLDGELLWTPLLIVLLKVVVIFVIGLVGTMFMVWFERKIVAGMQNRVGPNKAGPFGILQTLADGIKLFFKEDLLPEKADKWVFRLAPFLVGKIFDDTILPIQRRVQHNLLQPLSP